MTKANTRILGSAIALSLVMGAAGAAHAGLHMQATNLQGLHMQGLHMQGLHMQGTSMDAMLLANFRFLNGSASTNTYLFEGNQLRAYNGGTLVSDAGLLGSTFQATISMEDGTTRLVTLAIDAITSDSDTFNTMVCDPQQSQFVTNCGRGYNRNYGIKLYKLFYTLNSDPTQSGYLCAGDQNAMFFDGEWDEEGTWHAAPGKITVACTSGVITKCARNWGYKPWKKMWNKLGNEMDMRDYHIACTRAARADYPGNGLSFTLTDTMIDIFDNGGFNVPALGSALTAQGYQATPRFESIFTRVKTGAAVKNDYWGAWMSTPRYGELGLWEAMYGYDPIDWGGQLPKVDFPSSATTASIQSIIDGHLSNYGAELAVYDPIWSATGSQVASGNTNNSYDYTTGSCVPASGDAPDRAFRWTAPQSGTYRFDTNGSSFDTVLYIWENQSEVRCDDDAGTGTQSLTTYPVTAGQELTLFVDGYGAAAGDFKLNITKL